MFTLAISASIHPSFSLSLSFCSLPFPHPHPAIPQNTLDQLHVEHEHTERMHRDQRALHERQVADAVGALTQHKAYVAQRLAQLHRRTMRVKDSVQ